MVSSLAMSSAVSSSAALCKLDLLSSEESLEPAFCCGGVPFDWRPDIYLPSNNFLSHPSAYLFIFLMLNDLQEHKQPVVWKPCDNLRAAPEMEF